MVPLTAASRRQAWRGGELRAACRVSIRKFLKKSLSPLKPLWTSFNELALGIHTEADSSIGRLDASRREWWRGPASAQARHEDNFDYATIDYWNIRKMVRVLKPGTDDVFYDIGAGMGRIVCMLARTPLRKCVGIELLESLCRVARQNAVHLRRRRTPIEIVCGDATTADMNDGTIYFLFNPFGADTLRDTLENIRNSLSKNPRRIRIVYYNPLHESVLAGANWLEKVHQYESFGGDRVSIWKSRPCLGAVLCNLPGAH